APEARCSDLDFLQRALGQCSGNSHLLHLDLHAFGNLDYNKVVFDTDNTAGDSAAGDHFISLVETGNQLPVLLGTLALRAPQQEVKQQDKAAEEHDLHKSTRSLRYCFLRGSQCRHKCQTKSQWGVEPKRYNATFSEFNVRAAIQIFARQSRFQRVSAGVDSPRR